MLENNSKITMEQLEEIEEMAEVVGVECLGYSGQYPDHYWYSVSMGDGSDYDYFVKA